MELENSKFFAPSCSDAIDGLISQYISDVRRIDDVCEFMGGESILGSMSYFFGGYGIGRDRLSPDVGELFTRENAIKAANAHYWDKALRMTDVMEFMPDKRRWEWNESITGMTAPGFEEETVRSTMNAMLSKRMDFLAEMVDGAFRGLSGTHVTNQPEGFTKRFIVDRVIDDWGHSSDKKGIIHDIRFVISKFAGRDAPSLHQTAKDISGFACETGVWHSWDAGALRIRAYKKGTAHIEVNPEYAYRLNQILSHLYPNAIPNKNKVRPKKAKKQIKEFDLIDKPLSAKVLRIIQNAKFYNSSGRYYGKNSLAMEHGYSSIDKHARKEVADAIGAIGGVWVPGVVRERLACFVFDYDAESTLRALTASGCIPNHKSHQFYPTPDIVAEELIRMLGAVDKHKCLEPSAGHGSLAVRMPAGTKCVEISELHASILEGKGLDVDRADFLAWAEKTSMTFDRIAMNPPFSEGRAKAHIEAASKLLNNGGVLCAIVPDSYVEKYEIEGFSVEWSDAFKNQFAGTSISVAIMKVSLEKTMKLRDNIDNKTNTAATGRDES